SIIHGSIRTVDSAYRYGGDEFVVLLPETDIVGAFVVAEKIRIGAEEIGLSMGGLEPVTSVGIGLVSHPEDGLWAQELLDADGRGRGRPEGPRRRRRGRPRGGGPGAGDQRQHRPRDPPPGRTLGTGAAGCCRSSDVPGQATRQEPAQRQPAPPAGPARAPLRR